MSDKLRDKELRELVRTIRRDKNPDGDFVLSEAEATLFISGIIQEQCKAAEAKGYQKCKAEADEQEQTRIRNDAYFQEH